MRRLVRQIHISYLRQRVDSAPDIRCSTWNCKGKLKHIVCLHVDGKRKQKHVAHSEAGRRLLRIKQIKDRNKMILSKLESEWFRDYRDICDTVFVPDYGETANKIFFDSLVERCNNYKPFKGQKSPPPASYNGKYYKSKFESDFARLMDDYGISWKYEPRIKTVGRKTRCPDFILYLPWLDLLILVEIYGACGKKEYLPTVSERQHEYMTCNWLPGTSMLSLYYKDDTAYIPEIVIEEIETIACRRLVYLQNEGVLKKSA